MHKETSVRHHSSFMCKRKVWIASWMFVRRMGEEHVASVQPGEGWPRMRGLDMGQSHVVLGNSNKTAARDCV